jgi:hypothetical protein
VHGVTVELLSTTFSPHVGESFEVVPADDEPFAAVLAACEENDGGSPQVWLDSIGKIPFSLSLDAPSGVHHPQQTFTLRHSELGEFQLFLVPLGPRESGMRYHAVIS